MSHGNKQAKRISPASLGLPFCGADTHAHLGKASSSNEIDISEKFSTIISNAKEAGVSLIGQIFLHPDRYIEERELYSNLPLQVFFALAIHPMEAHLATDVVMHDISKAIDEDSRIKAVGETGLDYFWESMCNRATQQDVFRKHIDLALSKKLPLIIHSRDAASDTLKILEEKNFTSPLLWHCFSGDAINHLDRILANGWSIAVGGAITYPANSDIREAIKRIPLERLMLETDSPYLAPIPWRGVPNEPAFTAFTCAKVAEVLEIKPDVLWCICGENARNFFDIQ